MMGSDMLGLAFFVRAWRQLARRSAAHCSLWLLALVLGSASASAAPARVLVVGDSLSAEYGLARGTGWVALLAERLAREKFAVEVVNASISGDTTAGGRARLPALLKTHTPQVVVIELGGNDALRGLPVAQTRDNLGAMARAARSAGAKVLLAGMQVPPNYGRQYTADFSKAFEDVARSEQCPLVPFLLKGIADRADADEWFQADRIHPVAKAHPLIVDNVWPVLRPLLPTRAGA
jgi:acyl-CoA thioesterase I